MAEPPGFSRVAAGALDLRRGPQGPALMASGKARPHASCLRASQDSSPLDAGAYDFVWSRYWNLRIPLQCQHGSWGTSGVAPGETVLLSSGGMHVLFSPELQQQCHASLRVDQGICGFPWRLSHEAFPRGYPTRLFHLPRWCESFLDLKVEAVQGIQVSLEWTETSGGLWEW